VFLRKVRAHLRASRLVNLLLLLQSQAGVTAEGLAAELEVSVRTVYRDLQALALAGVPVYGVAGPGGGYRLVDGYRTRLTGLTAPEAGALLLVDLSVPLRALGLGSDLLAARLKVAAALSLEARSRAGELAGRVHLDLPGWFEEADTPPALPLLAEAVLSDRQVRFGYGDAGKEQPGKGQPGKGQAGEEDSGWEEPEGEARRSARRVVEPLGLVLKGRSWYLVARWGGRVLTFAVRRVRQPELLDGPVERPDDFDLAATWVRLVAEFEAGLPSVEVRLRASTVAMARLRRVVDSRNWQRTDWQVEPDESGWRCLSVSFERLEYARVALLGLGAEVEVLGPVELRQAIATEAGSLAQLYGRLGQGDRLLGR
jgi:predicted DNA-binding transcriptional regulator YafY